MRMDVGFILGHLFELVLLLYFANTSLEPRKSYLLSSAISLIGYVVLFSVGLLNNPIISISAFFIVNSLLLGYNYKISIGNALFFSLVLDALSVAGEYIVMYILGINYSPSSEAMTAHNSLLTTIVGKFIYLIGIIFLKRFTDKKVASSKDSLFILSIIPISTITCLTILMKSTINYEFFIIICILLILINVTVFAVYEIFSGKNTMLQKEYNRNKAELSEYQILAEKYENTRIMRHDFNKQLSVLKRLIADDNIRAQEYMQDIQYAQRELSYSQYTNNKIFNILLAQKIKECHKHNVAIHIQSSLPPLDFVSDIDTVAIFSNLLDNAIEASKKSDEKVIFVDIYTVNSSYTAIKIENSCDTSPITLNGMLQTQKNEQETHGIGIKSINSALKKYGSTLEWSYDKENRFFRAVILLHIPKNNKE